MIKKIYIKQDWKCGGSDRNIQISGLNPSNYLQYQFKDKKQRMIAQNQEFQASYFSQLEESLECVSSDKFQDLILEDLSNKSSLERYLCNEYQILKRDELALSRIWKISNINHLEWKIQSIRNYLRGQLIKQESESGKKQKRKQISSEFTLRLKSIPCYSIIYIHISEIQGNRFNMLIHNSKGECLGYFWKLLKCKKITKLRKIINSIASPLMILVIDESKQTIKSLVEIVQKIKDYVSQFAYISKSSHHIDVLQSLNEMHCQDQTQKTKVYTTKQFEKGIIMLSINMSQFNEINVLQLLIKSANRIVDQESQFLTAVRSDLAEKDRNLQFDFVLINIFRAHNCLPSQIIVIIQRLYMEQKQSFLKKTQIQKQKQLQRQYNRDPNNHFPQRISASKICKRCENLYKKKIRKTKFRCEGCSITFKKDICLCPLCFQDFHQRIQFFTKRLRKNRIGQNIRINNIKKQKNRCSLTELEKSEKKPSINMESQAMFEENQNNKKEQPIYDSVLIEKTNQINKLMNETFEKVQKLKQNGQFDILKLFLGSLLNCSLNKMKNLSYRDDQFNQGLTQIGSQVLLQVEKSKMIKFESFSKQQPPEKSSQSELSSESNEQ